MVTGYRQDRLAIQLGVIQPIQKMDASRTGGGHANSKLSGIFRIRTSHEGGRLLMPNLNKPDLLFARAQGFHDSVNSITRQAKNHFNAPVQKSIKKNISSSISHKRRS